MSVSSRDVQWHYGVLCREEPLLSAACSHLPWTHCSHLPPALPHARSGVPLITRGTHLDSIMNLTVYVTRRDSYRHAFQPVLTAVRCLTGEGSCDSCMRRYPSYIPQLAADRERKESCLQCRCSLRSLLLKLVRTKAYVSGSEDVTRCSGAAETATHSEVAVHHPRAACCERGTGLNSGVPPTKKAPGSICCG